MNNSKKYFKSLDLIRLISCILVLLYHFNILKGGYLAVCTFFVLSGYLSCISALKKEKFSFKEYYKNRFIHLYLPLIIVIFISIAVVSLIPSINWLNLKPETNSVLLGYNNFWQLNVNLDYFARHIDSPFMHFWYISILLQFDLVFPLIFSLLKKLGDKYDKLIPIIISGTVSFISTIYFIKLSLDSNIMGAYYNTFARSFSIFFGLLLGFIHSSFGPLVFKKLKDGIFNKVIFIIYLLIFIFLNIFIGSDSQYFNVAMILVTFISMRLIDYGTLNISNKPNKVLKFLSGLTYEIYLVQYPVIFLFQDFNINVYLKYTIMIIIIFILSYLIHASTDKNREKGKILKNILAITFIAISIYGIYVYAITEDHTAEMKKLEEQLNQNKKLMEKQQEEYQAKLQEEKEKWEKMMSDLDSSEENIKMIASDVTVVGVGDSVMLGALPDLSNTFKNGYFDAGVSRTCYVANDILKSLINKKALGDIIVFNFGANGDCPNSVKNTIMKTIGNRELFWLTVTNDKSVHFNDKINKYAENYKNIHIVDWNSISKGHKEYFIADGIHLTSTGRKAFANTIYNAIYQFYLDEFNAKKEEILKKHDEEMKTKISFYGNELLVNAFDYLKDEFKTSNFTINKDFNFEEIKAEIEKNIADNSLNYKVVFAFDKTLNLNQKEYESLIDLCKDHEIYILNLNNKLNLENYNVKVIDFYNDLEKNNEYLMVDKIHLTPLGNEALANKIIEYLKNN